MVRRLFGSSAIVLATAAVIVGRAVPAAAQVPDPVPGISDVIAFVGQANITSDQPGAFMSPEPDVPAAVDFMGGGGTFTFNSIVCAGWSDATEAGLCSITNAGGSFTNIACGTGSVAAGAGATISGPEGGTASFSITFAAAIGVIAGTISTSSPDGEEVGGNPEPIHGIVVLAPPANPAPPNAADPGDCTTGFTPIGVVVAVEPPLP